MKFFSSLVLGALLAGSLYGDGFGFNIGPFDLQFGVGSDGYYESGYEGIYNQGRYVQRNAVLDNPICDAISHQQQLGFTVEGREVVNTKEVKIITKHLIVEPYAFGVTRDGKPVLRGKVIDEKLVKEVSVKFGEERFDEPKKDSAMSGWFHSSDKVNIDIQNIRDIQIISGSHFDAPKDFEGIRDDNIRVICQLPIKSAK